MSQPFKLKNPIGEAYSMGAEDTLNTKKALATLGHMETPDYGLDEYPDLPMIDAVKSFQRDNALVEDGVMKPDGPTLARLNETLATKAAPPALLQASSEPNAARDRHLMSLPSQSGARPTIPKKPIVAPGSQVAMGPAAALIPPLLGAVARTAIGNSARTAAGAAAAGAAGSLITNSNKGKGQEQPQKRTDQAPSFPPMPGIEPPDTPLPDRTESIPQPVELPDFSGSLPKTIKPTIFVLPAPEPGEFGDSIVERKGNEATRKELERIRDYFEQVKGWKHVAGGRYSPLHDLVRDGEKNAGDEQNERHIKGYFNGLKGGHFTDLTFIDDRGRTVHIQSVDVDKNGKPTQRELDNAEKIRRATENEDILLIPKGAQLTRNRKLQ